MIAEEQDEKKPSPKQKQMHGDLEDKAFKGTPKGSPQMGHDG
jgi:hypothetical protein